MELKDVKVILKRIQVNYPSFTNDSYTQSEWYRELKDYDMEDVMKKLEEHMRSEQYGATTPKLYFLTKYLKTTKEKQKVEHFKLQCSICGKFVDEELFDKHYERCLDVNYIYLIRKIYFDTEISDEMKERYRNLSDESFNTKYMEFLDNVYDRVSKEEQNRINTIINPKRANISHETESNEQLDSRVKKIA